MTRAEGLLWQETGIAPIGHVPPQAADLFRLEVLAQPGDRPGQASDAQLLARLQDTSLINDLLAILPYVILPNGERLIPDPRVDPRPLQQIAHTLRHGTLAER